MTLQLYLLKFGFKERAWLGKMMKKSWLRTDDVVSQAGIFVGGCVMSLNVRALETQMLLLLFHL